MTADELAGALRSLDVDVSNLLATWKGSSASAYSAGWEETKQGAMEVLEALAAIAELLGVNSRVFAEQDTDNSQGFGSLNIQV